MTDNKTNEPVKPNTAAEPKSSDVKVDDKKVEAVASK